MNKHEAMKTYLQDHVTEIAHTALRFNTSESKDGSIAFITQYADKNIKTYFSGYLREYGFAVLISALYSPDQDDLNLQAMSMAQEFQDWIDQQHKEKHYPDFGGKCTVRKIESVQNMPNLSGIDDENMIAQYMLQCKVTYYEAK